MSDPRSRAKSVTVRFNPEERALLEVAAKGSNLATFIRQAAIEKARKVRP